MFKFLVFVFLFHGKQNPRCVSTRMKRLVTVSLPFFEHWGIKMGESSFRSPFLWLANRLFLVYILFSIIFIFSSFSFFLFSVFLHFGECFDSKRRYCSYQIQKDADLYRSTFCFVGFDCDRDDCLIGNYHHHFHIWTNWGKITSELFNQLIIYINHYISFTFSLCIFLVL